MNKEEGSLDYYMRRAGAITGQKLYLSPLLYEELKKKTNSTDEDMKVWTIKIELIKP